MILVRPYEASDLARIRELHQKQNLGYDAPDWDKALLSAVVETDGEVTMAAFLRKTAEVYLVVDDSAGRKRDRLAQLLMLHRELIPPCKRVGFEDVHCWLPPVLDERFGKLLMHLGWEKSLWPSYARETR